VSLNNIVSGQ